MVEAIDFLITEVYVMKNFLIVVGGILVMILPGAATILLLWTIVYPPHRRIVLNHLSKWKGDLFMSLNHVKGYKNETDKYLAEKVDFKDINTDRTPGTYYAWKYLISKNRVISQPAISPGLIVLAFGIGCGLVGFIWFMTIHFNILQTL